MGGGMGEGVDNQGEAGERRREIYLESKGE